MSEIAKSYRDLRVWQMGMDLVVEAYKVSHGFPKHEQFGLTSQLRRAAVSVPSNIAEGNARDSTKEYLHHVSFAHGSVAEVETQLLIAVRLGYLPEEEAQELLDKCRICGRMLQRLRMALQNRIGDG